VYKTIRELALSYFENYFNLRGERTLRGYSMIVDLKSFDRFNWMTSEKSVWSIPEFLVTCRHYPLFPARIAKGLPLLDKRSFAAGVVGRLGKH
jgi:hypothetical protein